MTVVQKNTAGLIAWPFAGEAGCACFTFDSGATPAQLAQEPTLVDNWTDLMAAVTTGHLSPVTVNFLSNATIPTGTSVFPNGSTFMGVDQFQISFQDNVTLQGVAYWTNLQIVPSPTSSTSPIVNEDSVHLSDCTVTYGGGGSPLFSYSTTQCILRFEGCGDVGRPDAGVDPIIFVADAITLNLILIGTVFFPPGIGSDASANTIAVVIGADASFSRGQTNFNFGAGGIVQAQGRVHSLGGRGTGSGIIDLGSLGGNFVFGQDGGTSVQSALSVGLIYVGNSAGGTINLTLGPSGVAYTPGQVIVIKYQGASDGSEGANKVQIMQPDGATPVVFGPATGTAVIGGNGSSAHCSVTVVADSATPSVSALFTLIDAGPLI